MAGHENASRHRREAPFAAMAVGGLGEALELAHQVGLFPGEAAVGVGLASEVAIGGGAGVDRLVQAQMLADRARAAAACTRYRPD